MSGEPLLALVPLTLVTVLVVALFRQMPDPNARADAKKCRKCGRRPVMRRICYPTRGGSNWYMLFLSCTERWFSGPCSVGRRAWFWTVDGNERERECEATALKYWNEGDRDERDLDELFQQDLERPYER